MNVDQCKHKYDIILCGKQASSGTYFYSAYPILRRRDRYNRLVHGTDDVLVDAKSSKTEASSKGSNLEWKTQHLSSVVKLRE